MELHAIKITKSALPLITLLNAGVTPAIQKKSTYFLFDAEWNSEVPNEIVTERELEKTCTIKAHSPFVLAIKK